MREPLRIKCLTAVFLFITIATSVVSEYLSVVSEYLKVDMNVSGR